MKTPSKFAVGLFALGAIAALTACKSHERRIWFGNLKNGQEVESPFKVEMKQENLIVEPAAKGVTEGHGHFHIIINSPMPPATSPIPKDPMHIHYGQGDTETTMILPVGEYDLLLQFAKGDHVPYNPQITSEVIHIRVVKQNTPDTTKASR